MTTFVHDDLFTAEPRLLGSHCSDCDGYHFPRHETCPYCSSDSVRAVELSPTGSLWSWTAVTAAPPGYEGDVPFGFGVVELPEGVRVITRLTESDPHKLQLGQEMRLVLAPLHDDVVTYAFERA
ncbi:MAG: Zn-ribbon domain-containing OB-fold protein [Actinomycetes bacterium]